MVFVEKSDTFYMSTLKCTVFEVSNMLIVKFAGFHLEKYHIQINNAYTVIYDNDNDMIMINLLKTFSTLHICFPYNYKNAS